MIDVEKFINALKSSWIKIIIEYTEKNQLKYIFTPLLNRYGGNLVFECNLNKNDLNQYFKNSRFLLDVLTAWNNIVNCNPNNAYITLNHLE